MPNYQFKCNNCDNIFTEFVKIENRVNVICPICGGDVKQCLSALNYIKKSAPSQGNCARNRCNTCGGC